MINYEELLPADKKALEKAIENKAFDFQIGYLNARIYDLEQEMEICSQEDDYVADLNKEVNRLNKVIYQICKAKKESFYIDHLSEKVYIAEKNVDAKEVEHELG